MSINLSSGSEHTALGEDFGGESRVGVEREK